MKAIKDYLFEILLAIISVSLLVLLVAPYWFGYQMQSSYEKLIGSISSNSNYSYEVVEFDRGWFSTHADLLIKSTANQPMFYFRHRIIHGPVYLGLMLEGKSPLVGLFIQGQLLSIPESNHLLAQLFDNKNDPVTIEAVLRINDDALLDFNIPDVSKAISANQYDVSGSALTLEYFSQASRFIGELKVDEFLVQGDTVIELSQLLLNFDQTVKQGSVTGDLVVSLDSLKLKLLDQLTSFMQLSTRIKNNKANSLMDLDIDVNAAKINAFNEQLNSLSLGLKLSSVYYDLFAGQIEDQFFSDTIDKPVDWHVFGLLEVKPFSFFSERGAFSSNLQLKNIASANTDMIDFYHRYNTQLNVEVSDILLKRLYEIVISTFHTDKNEASLFIDKMQQVNYLERNANKLLLRLQSKDGKYLINDLLIPYQDFEANLTNALHAK